MLAHAHGRIDHAIAEEPSGGQPVGHVLEIGGRRPRTVEQELVVVAPDLGVAGHRLVVEADVVGSGAEEHVGQLVLGAGDGQGVFIAQDPLPAVRAAERVPDRPIDVRFVTVATTRTHKWVPAGRPGLVQPARLGNADRAGGLVAEQRLQQRYLPGQRQLPLEFQVGRRRRKQGCPGTAAGSTARPGSFCGPPPAGTSKGRRSTGSGRRGASPSPNDRARSTWAAARPSMKARAQRPDWCKRESPPCADRSRLPASHRKPRRIGGG